MPQALRTLRARRRVLRTIPPPPSFLPADRIVGCILRLLELVDRLLRCAAVRRTETCESCSDSIKAGSDSFDEAWTFTCARKAAARISASSSFTAVVMSLAESAAPDAASAGRIASRSGFVDFG